MKRLIILLALAIGMSAVATAQGKSTDDNVVKASFQAIVSDDLAQGMGLMGIWLGIESSPNPLESLKDKQVRVEIEYSGMGAGHFHAYDGKKEVFGFGLSSCLIWSIEDKRLFALANGYCLQVMPLDAKPYVNVLKYGDNSKVEHMWDFTPTAGTDKTWLYKLLADSYWGMSQLKALAGGMSGGSQWAERLNDLERHFPKLKSAMEELMQPATTTQRATTTQPATTTQRAATTQPATTTQKTPAQQLSASQLLDAARRHDADAMFTLGMRYHDGTLSSIRKNDHEAYRWLMKAHMVAYKANNKANGKTIRDYIMTNLPKQEDRQLTEDFTTLSDTTLTPLQLALHPFATLPTAAAFMKGKEIAAAVQAQRQWEFDTKNKKSITIYDNNQAPRPLPALYGQRAFTIDWNCFNKTPSYSYSFTFGTLEQAEQFAMRSAYDLRCEGIDFTDYPTSNYDGTFMLFGDVKIFVGSKYYTMSSHIGCHSVGSGKYIVSIEFTLLKSRK